MKKNKMKIIITIITIIFILIAAFLWIFFNTDIFRTKRSSFYRYLQAIPETLNIIEENQKEFQKYNEQKENVPYIRKANITIESSSNIANSNILDKIKVLINEKNDSQNEKCNIDITVNNSNSKISEISFIRNNNIIGAKSDDIVNGYVCLKNEGISRITKDISKENIIIADEINKINISKILETTKVEKNKIDSLNEIIKNTIPVTSYSKEKRNKIKINEKIYTTTAYSVSLDKSESANLQVNILNKISQDSILMDYITSKLKLLNINEEYTSINSLNSKIKDRIKTIKQNPNIAEEIKIIVHEYKQKNIKTEIQFGQYKIEITHLTNGQDELSSIKLNDDEYGIEKSDDKYILTYKNEKEEKSTRIEYNQTGSIENNDIKNYMTIIQKDGIKNITFKYDDNVNFTNDIGIIKDFSNENYAIINDYNDDEIKSFIVNLKQKINQTYINKGAQIGINLDPIFEIE